MAATPIISERFRNGILRTALAACFATACMAPHGPLTEPMLTEEDDGARLTLAPGDEFRAMLQATPSTGYRWVVIEAGTSPIEQLGKPALAGGAEDGRVGVAGTETWRFRAVRPGQTLLRFEYRRPWEPTLPPARAVAYTIEVH